MPSMLIDLLQAQRFTDEGFADEEFLAMPVDGAIGSNPAYDVVCRVAEGDLSLPIVPLGVGVDLRRFTVAQRFVWPQVVEV